MLLPPRFAAFLDNSFDTGRAVLLECIRLNYNYENVYRLIPLTNDVHGREYPDHVEGRLVESGDNPTHRLTGSLQVQLSSTQTISVNYCIPSFHVLLDNEPSYYDDYTRMRRRGHDASFPLVLLTSPGRMLYGQNTRLPTCVDLTMSPQIRRHLLELRNNMPQNHHDRHPRTPSPIRRHPYRGFDDIATHWDNPFEEAHSSHPREYDIIPPPPPRLSSRINRQTIRGAGGGAGRAGVVHPPAGEPRQIIIQPRHAPPSERVCIAVARDFILQQEPCPILQEPLTWGSIAVTACYCVFTGDSLAVWAADHTTCPSCRQTLEFRVVNVEKPVDEGQPRQQQETQPQQQAQPQQQGQPLQVLEGIVL